MTSYTEILDAERALTATKKGYLRRHGWQETCSVPGAYWLWERDFAAEDAEVVARWEANSPGPLGKPNRPRPHGRITAPLDLAVSMTRATLDRDDDLSEED